MNTLSIPPPAPPARPRVPAPARRSLTSVAQRNVTAFEMSARWDGPSHFTAQRRGPTLKSAKHWSHGHREKETNKNHYIRTSIARSPPWYYFKIYSTWFMFAYNYNVTKAPGIRPSWIVIFICEQWYFCMARTAGLLPAVSWLHRTTFWHRTFLYRLISGRFLDNNFLRYITESF